MGEIPMIRLAAAIPPTVTVIIGLRPSRSASRPMTNPPTGRATKPTANTARLASTAETASAGSKNWVAKNGTKIA